jgi:hypothetical protein
MNLKKLIVRIVVAATLGLCAGLIMECLASWRAFPEFLIWGFLGGIFAGIVIEVLSCDYSITRDDLRRAEKPVIRILVVMAIGLLVGAVFEYVAVGALYPVCLILGGAYRPIYRNHNRAHQVSSCNRPYSPGGRRPGLGGLAC